MTSCWLDKILSIVYENDKFSLFCHNVINCDTFVKTDLVVNKLFCNKAYQNLYFMVIKFINLKIFLESLV